MEVLSEFEKYFAGDSHSDHVGFTNSHEGDIGFGKIEFSWTARQGASDPSSRPDFHLCIEDDVKFKKGGFNLIIGPTGSGKTSVLMALLGEMHQISSSPDSWVNLPREHGVAYAAQESWVLSDTIKVGFRPEAHAMSWTYAL